MPLKDKVKLRAYQKEWKALNRERVRAGERARYRRNPEKQKQASVRWMVKNAASKQAYNREYNKKHPEIMKKSGDRYRKAHPDRINAKLRNRSSRKRSARGTCSADQANERIAFYGGLCAYCRVAEHEHLDHVVPLARGGTNWPANLRPSCASCNCSKSDKLLSEWKNRPYHTKGGSSAREI